MASAVVQKADAPTLTIEGSRGPNLFEPVAPASAAGSQVERGCRGHVVNLVEGVGVGRRWRQEEDTVAPPLLVMATAVAAAVAVVPLGERNHR